jgi:hypothetical protein
LNPGYQSERTATNRLGYDTAQYGLVKVKVKLKIRVKVKVKWFFHIITAYRRTRSIRLIILKSAVYLHKLTRSHPGPTGIKYSVLSLTSR